MIVAAHTPDHPAPEPSGSEPSPPDHDAGDTGDTGDTTDTEPRAAPQRAPLLPWIIALAALVMAGISTWQWLSLDAERNAREEVQRAAEVFVIELTNWDASDGLEDTREDLEAVGTGAFVEEVDELFGGSLGADLEAAGAVSRGEVQDVFVQRIEGDEAVVFAVAIQELSTDLSDTPERTVRSARIELTRQEGRWLVSSVQLLADGGAAPAETTTEDPEAGDGPTAEEPTAEPAGEGPTGEETPS